MDSLTEAELNKYRKIWRNPKYRERSPGFRHLETSLEWIQPECGASFTDWGCGTGRVAHALHDLGHPVQLVDITKDAYRGSLTLVEASLWDLPDAVVATDHGFCADVMEHIPPEKVQDTFDQLRSRTLKSCFFQIALFEDHFGDTIGETLHLSVFPSSWWRKRVLQSFGFAEFRLISAGRHLLALAKP